MTSQGDGSASQGAKETALHLRIQVLEAEAAEYQRTRQRLEEEYSFREAVIERAAEGICVCHAIPDHPFVQFTVWNRRMTDLTGYSMEKINRIGWYQTVYTDPEVRDRARQRMAQMREGVDLLDEQWEINRADGEKRILNISTSIIKSSDGLIHALALMQDVTNDVLYRRHLESRVERLEGLLPICASCKKIRDATGTWHQLETFISSHSEARFSHSICQDCVTKLYPEMTHK